MASAADRLQRTFGAPGRLFNRGVDSLANIGQQLTFMAKSLADIVPAARHTGEVSRLISEITLGAGALLVGAGTAGVIFFMAFFTGTQVGLEGFKGLQLIGAEAFTGFISAFANTREITPLIAGVTLAAQIGCGFTA
ncbi:MAG TPA: ABC transporter permease, partial [Actinomycetota bacterium]|nr:ABC transporter permease [Actinomycetota bacterium]